MDPHFDLAGQSHRGFPRRRGDGPLSENLIGQIGMFPRRRGDGPLEAELRTVWSQFPPQARGWTSMGSRHPDQGYVSPAGAGMDPAGESSHKEIDCFPRRRGDGPFAPIPSTRRSLFPPQARGWTPRYNWRILRNCVSPAGAGMDRDRRVHGLNDSRFPRRRGDGPRSLRWHKRQIQFPPQARGWTVIAQILPIGSAVSPAGAGMDPMARKLRACPCRFPRRRGDGPRARNGRYWRKPFPPQARGWTAGNFSTHRDPEVSPAGAGMDP